MFSRNFHHGSKSRDGTPFTENSPYKYNNGAGEQESPANSFFTRSNDKRDSRASMKKSRPHSWHSTLQRGLARARSRSSGREKEKDRVKRASSALNAGKRGSTKCLVSKYRKRSEIHDTNVTDHLVRGNRDLSTQFENASGKTVLKVTYWFFSFSYSENIILCGMHRALLQFFN